MLIQDINSLAVQQATSVATQVVSSVESLLAASKKTVGDSLLFLQNFTDVYSNDVEYVIQGLSNTIVWTASQLAEVQFLLISLTDVTLDSTGIEKIRLLQVISHVSAYIVGFEVC